MSSRTKEVDVDVEHAHADADAPSTPPSDIDIEKQHVQPGEPTPSSPPSTPAPTPSSDDDEATNIPHLTLPRLFWLFFYHFGCFAWGGPVAQIALIKDTLVLQQKWITPAKFQRVFAVYQLVPGPEAAELCMYFGCLARGRVGGLLAGVGFVAPGCVLMVLASWAYAKVGLGNVWVNASFRALQPVVAAMILRAVHKLAEHTFPDHKTKKINPWLVAAAFFTAINTALRINIFISLGLWGLLNVLLHHRLYLPALALFLASYGGYATYCALRGGPPSPVSLALGIARTPDLPHLFLLGLVAGSLSFGGAYTAIPFVQVEAVLLGGWLPLGVFIDCIAIGNILPAPLVVFATFVGYQGALGYSGGNVGYALAGAAVITLGMLAPCFAMVILGHSLLERVVNFKLLIPFLDGLVGAVIGVIAIIAMQILQGAIVNTRTLAVPVTPPGSPALESAAVLSAARSGISAVLYCVALMVLYRWGGGKYTAILLVVAAAVAGQFLFVDLV